MLAVHAYFVFEVAGHRLCCSTIRCRSNSENLNCSIALEVQVQNSCAIKHGARQIYKVGSEYTKVSSVGFKLVIREGFSY